MAISRLVTLALLLLIAGPASADELTASKRADIERLLQMTGALDIGKQMSAAVVNQMTKVVRQARPDIPSQVMAVMSDEINAVVSENVGDFKEAVIPIYHNNFTAEEVKGMIDFYSTDLGKKTIRVMPSLLNESMQAGQQWGQSLGPIIDQRIRARLKKEGYKI